MASSADRTIVFVTIVCYILVMVGVALYYSRKVKKASDLTVGGRNAGAWLSALSYGTAYFSAVMFVGYAGATGWNFALWATLAGIGNAVFGSYFAWKVLATRTRDVSRRLKIKSMPQYLSMRFSSHGIRTFSAVVIFIFLIPYSASVYKGLASICKVMLGISELPCMIVIALVSAALLFFGGYLAQVRADFVQGIVMMVGVTLMILFVIRSRSVSGTEKLLDGFRGIASYAGNGGLPSLTGSQWVSLIATVLMTSFGTWGLPQMIQKYFGIKDDAQAKKGIIISTVFCVLVAGGGYFIGGLAHMFFSELPAGGQDYLIPNMLLKSDMPSILTGIVIVLLISASVSTLSSISLTASSVFSMDLIKERRKNMSDDSLKKLLKLSCLLFVAFSFVVANTDTPILDMMSYSWGIISGSFLAPYVLPLYWKRMNRAGAWAAIISGFSVAIIPAGCKVLSYAFTNDTVTFLAGKGPVFAVAAMIISILAAVVVTLLTSKSSSEESASELFYTGDVRNLSDGTQKI